MIEVTVHRGTMSYDVLGIDVIGHSDDLAVCAHVTGIVSVCRKQLGGTQRAPKGGGRYKLKNVDRDESVQTMADGIVQAFQAIARRRPKDVVVIIHHR